MIKESVNISQLQNVEDDVKKVFGVIVDDFATDINNDLDEISILAADNGDGDLDVDVIDSILAYVTVGVRVTLEIPYDSQFSPSNIVILASSSNFSISIIPPHTINEDENVRQAYTQKVLEYVDCWIDNPNSQTDIMPFSNYFSYLISRELGHVPETLSSDEYTISRFVNVLSKDSSERIKEFLYEYIVNSFGGEEEFSSYAHTLGYVISDFTKGEIELTKEIMESDTGESEPSDADNDSGNQSN